MSRSIALAGVVAAFVLPGFSAVAHAETETYVVGYCPLDPTSYLCDFDVPSGAKSVYVHLVDRVFTTGVCFSVQFDAASGYWDAHGFDHGTFEVHSESTYLNVYSDALDGVLCELTWGKEAIATSGIVEVRWNF